MQSDDKQLYASWNQITKACKSKQEKERLKKSLTPFVESIADNYSSQTDTDKQKLVEAGFTHFDTALQNYYERTKRRKRTGEKIYPFSKYFRWWVKRDIEQHIGIAKDFSWKEILIMKTRSLFKYLKTSFLLLFKD